MTPPSFGARCFSADPRPGGAVVAPLLFALFRASFAIGTTEFAVVGLLRVSPRSPRRISQTGLLVSGYAIGVAVGGPAIVALTSSQPRKRTLLQLCAIFVVGHALAALAPDMVSSMGARVFAAVSHASFLGIAAIVAQAVFRLSEARAPSLSSGWGSPPQALSASQARLRSATRLAGAPPSGCSRSLASLRGPSALDACVFTSEGSSSAGKSSP